MKWQVLLLTLASLVAFAVGGAKWRARFRASGDLEKAEDAGNWVMVVSRNPGLELRSRSSGVVEVPKPWRDLMTFESVEVTPDLRRIAWIDAATYDKHKILVASSDAPKTPLLTYEVSQGGQLSCPTFDADGALLWYETDPYNTGASSYSRPVTRLRQLVVPPPGRTAGAAREIPLPVGIAPEDCFERSADGSVIAWAGTDLMVHTARREPGGGLAGLQSFAGSDFALSHDGTFLALNESGRIATVDIATGKRAFVGEARTPRIYALSPDDRWVLAQSVGAYNASTAWRLSDGAPVGMGQPTSYVASSRRQTWIAWTGEKLPEPVATPTPKPTRTPRRPKPSP